jgi:hypothetical protein
VEKAFGLQATELALLRAKNAEQQEARSFARVFDREIDNHDMEIANKEDEEEEEEDED